MSPKGRPEGESAPKRVSAEGGPDNPKGRPEGESAPKRVGAEGGPESLTLDAIAPGRTVLLARIDDALPADFREQLAAYGFVPGRALEVVAQRPMTVVACDHVELALEAVVAGALVVRQA